MEVQCLQEKFSNRTLYVLLYVFLTALCKYEDATPLQIEAADGINAICVRIAISFHDSFGRI